MRLKLGYESQILQFVAGLKLRIQEERMALSKEKVSAIVKEYGKDEKDTGSTEVQIALLSAQIARLTDHLKANKKDQSARRGLLCLVGQRRGLLDYLERTDHEAYVALLGKLNLRK